MFLHELVGIDCNFTWLEVKVQSKNIIVLVWIDLYKVNNPLGLRLLVNCRRQWDRQQEWDYFWLRSRWSDDWQTRGGLTAIVNIICIVTSMPTDEETVLLLLLTSNRNLPNCLVVRLLTVTWQTSGLPLPRKICDENEESKILRSF